MIDNYLIFYIILCRLFELLLSRRNTSKLLKEGGVEYYKNHYKYIVFFHVIFIIFFLIKSINDTEVNMEYLYTFLSEKNVTKLKIFTDSLCLIFFLILFYVSCEITYESFVKNYNTGTVWGPPLWIPYSSMLIGATLMTMSYISELILHVRKLKEFK